MLQLLDEVRAQVAVIRPPAFNRFPNNFSHIFAGGYAAGITVTSGPRCCRPMRTVCSKKTVC